MRRKKDPMFHRVRRVYTIRDVIGAYIVGGVAFLALVLFGTHA